MSELNSSTPCNERINSDSPHLVAALKEMKEGLDVVQSKIKALTAKVKTNGFPTSDGISYLETKHLLLLNYCQSVVYYLLRKAKGFSVQGHPVVRSLVETRLFLEKIRPIDKKFQYQIQKLTCTVRSAKLDSVDEAYDSQKTDDLLKYRPNPELLERKEITTLEDDSGVYRPPKFAPVSMEVEDKMSRQERNALRKETEMIRQANQSAYVRELMNDLEGKPEEVRETVGAESKEMTKYITKMEERARQEEDLFSRAPLTKIEKKKMKHMRKSRNGLLGLTESFYDEIKALPLDSSATEQPSVLNHSRNVDRKFKKRKHKH